MRIFIIPSFIILLLLNMSTDVKCIEFDRLKVGCVNEPLESGLIYYLDQPFETRWKIPVEVVKLNIGDMSKAIEEKSVDFVLINCKDVVEKMVAQKLLSYNRVIMYNYIFIFGPSRDPCSIEKNDKLVDCFKTINNCNRLFYSTDNDSGIDRFEKSIWKPLGGVPADSKFIKTGFDNKTNLIQADKQEAYCLTDSGTYYSNASMLSGKLFCIKDKTNKNEYFGCVVTEGDGKKNNYVSAMAYFGWLTSNDAQKMIFEFTKNGKNIFNPIKIKISLETNNSEAR
jgi:tungstate transport system substrate-binding protein